jgi:tetratricopeptide (TPR) repeat protein
LFECTYRCCEAAFYVEHMERVKALVAALLRLAANDAEQAMAHIMQAAEANVLFRATEAESAAHRGLEFARRSGSGLLELRAMQQLAGALARLGRADEGVALMQPLLAGLEQSADAATQRAFLSDYALVLDYANRRADALAVRERVIALATAEEDWSTVHVTLTDQAISSYYLGELEQSTAQYERARSLKERLGAGKGWSAMDDMALAGDLSDLGRYAEALALYEVALTALRRGGFEVWIALTECDLAVTWLHLGQMQRAAHLVQEPRADASPFVRLYYHATCARLQRARQASAREQLQRAIEVAAVAGGRDYLRLKLNTELNREVDPAAGARTLESIAAEAGRRQYFGLQRVALLYRCDCLRRAGVSAEACALAHDVSAAFAQIAPVIVYAGDVWWLLFQAFDAGGDAAAADAALRRGVHWINEVALPNVPAEFRDSFLNRNLTNRALVTAASRRLHS